MDDNDLRLPLLVEANLHLNIGEEAADDGSFETARRSLEKADIALEELRTEYIELEPNRQQLLKAMATPLSKRAKALRARLPKASVLSTGKVEHDPEQDEEPEL